jgi:hypothetical protein
VQYYFSYQRIMFANDALHRYFTFAHSNLDTAIMAMCTSQHGQEDD